MTLSLKPSRVFLYSIFIVLSLLFFGPGEYFSDRFNFFAACYLGLCFLIFYFGLRFSEGSRAIPLSANRLPRSLSVYRLNRSCIIYITLFVIIGFLSSLYYFGYNLFEYNAGFGVSALDARAASEKATISLSKPLLYKVALFFSSTSVIFLPLILSVRQRSQPLLSLFVLLASSSYSCSQLMTGNRNPAIFQILFMLLSYFYGIKFNGVLPSTKRIIQTVMAIFIPSLLVVILFTFAWRQSIADVGDYDLDSLQKASQFLGGYDIRHIYSIIYSETKLSFLPLLFDLSFYITHSIPFFLSLFELTNYEPNFSFVFTLPGIYILTGNSNYVLESVSSQVFSGMYPTAVHGFLMDFGIFIGPIVIFMVGIVLGRLFSHTVKTLSYSSLFFPLSLIVPAIFPIYYVSWGASDIIALAGVVHVFMLFSFLKGRIYRTA